MEGDGRNPRVSLLKKYDIPIDHLSFEYVETCTDKKELERIAKILRSGEEGNYPDLIKTVENKLRQIAPDSRVLRVETPVLKKDSFSSEQWEWFEKDLELWENEMRMLDLGLDYEKKRFDTIGNKNLPELRKVTETKPEKMVHNEIGGKKVKVETKKNSERIKSSDYAAWEKFDVDKELLRLDLEDEREEEKNSKMKREMEKKAKQVEKKKTESLNFDPDAYSDLEQQILSSQAKDRGNECFKSGDYEQALKYYKVSLKLFPNAATYNNRAMTYIKLKNYEEALQDCNEVLKREPNNIKALHRRATSYQNLPGEKNNELAFNDISQIVSLEPSNRVAQSDLQILKNKLNIQDIGRKFRMMIEESGNDEMKELLSKSNNVQNNSYYNDEDEIVDIRKLPLTYYGPSTSTFQCEPHSMTHRMLADPNFSGQVMCKCNSNATRQNPLCHNCGQRLSRPKQKPKPKKPKEDVGNGNSYENCKPEIKAESKSMSVNGELNGENKKSKVETDGMKQSSSEYNSFDSHEKNNETKSGLNYNAFNKSEEENNNILEANGNVNIKEESVWNKEGNGGIQNVIDEMKNEKYFEKKNVCNGEIKAEERESPDINGNGLTVDELDLNGIEEKNDTEECKDLGKVSVDDLNSSDNKGQSNSTDSLEKVVGVANETTEEEKITENDSNCQPSTSNPVDCACDSKKSRSKKKKSRESRTEELPYICTEPVKIVQAPKYLKPTSSESKSESDKPKEDNASECKGQFKSFVSSKKRPGTEGGVLTLNTSFSSNQREKESSVSQPVYSPVNVNSDSEGNKENILENGNDQSNFKTPFSGEDTVPIGSSFEFMKMWESTRKSDESYEKRAQIIRYLRPEDLKTVIGNNLDSDMLKSLLECLEKHFLDNDPKKVISFLKELPRVPRFSIINLFLNTNEREVLQRLIEKTEKKGYLLDEEVKNSLKTSF